MSWTTAFKTVYRACFLQRPIDTWYSSSDELAGQEWLSDMQDWANRFNLILGESWIDTSLWTKERAYFPTGVRATALTSNAKNFRNKEGDVILDEFAFNENQRDLYKAAQPCLKLIPHAQLTVISTHDGPETMFSGFCIDAEAEQRNPRCMHQSCRAKLPVSGPQKCPECGRDTSPRWSHHRVTIFDAVRDGLALRVWGSQLDKYGSREALDTAYIDDAKAGCATPEDFEQEYNCCPAKYSTLVSAEDYEKLVLQQDGVAIEIPDCLDPEQSYGELFVGIDCGRVHDFTVVWVLERGYDPTAKPHLADVFRTVAVRYFRNEAFPVQEAFIRQVVDHACLSKGLIDMGTVGRGLSESIQDITGGVIKQYAFTAPRMAMIAERVRQMTQQHRVSLHPSPFVRSDVLCVRRTVTPAGGKKYGGNTKETHGDFFWALALALESAAQVHGVQVATAESVQDEIEAEQQRALPA